VPGALAPHTATERQGARSGTAQAIWPEGSELPTSDSERQGGWSGTAQAIWPEGSELPTSDSPGLALVLVPRTGVVGTATATSTPTPSSSTSSPSSSVSTTTLTVPEPVTCFGNAPSTVGTPSDAVSGDIGSTGTICDAAGPTTTVAAGSPAATWVFPFDPPAAPEAGDNQALAVNTLDGSTVYDVAFALVWANGDRVLNTNEAYAFASCTGCRTVSVGFQIVLVLGHANVVAPQNLAGAINYSCVKCVTYALATQLVVTLSGPLDQQGDADLAALWEEISAFGESIEGVALSELQSRLTDYGRRILDIIRRSSSAVPVGASEAPEASLVINPRYQWRDPGRTPRGGFPWETPADLRRCWRREGDSNPRDP
jgi:putative peptide zinc metalloprotease protein